MNKLTKSYSEIADECWQKIQDDAAPLEVVVRVIGKKRIEAAIEAAMEQYRNVSICIYCREQFYYRTPEERESLTNHILTCEKKSPMVKLVKQCGQVAEEALSLVDGCYEIIELFKPTSPAQEVWREQWLKRARDLVPQDQPQL